MSVTCPTPRKVRHPNQASAEWSADRVRDRRGSPVRVYECSCGGWHLTKRLAPDALYALVRRADEVTGGALIGPDGETVGHVDGKFRVLDDAWLAFHGYRNEHARSLLVGTSEQFEFVGEHGQVGCTNPSALKARRKRAAKEKRLQARDTDEGQARRREKRRRQRQRRQARRAAERNV